MTDNGKWPNALMRFLYDFLPARMAPDSDGIVAPEFEQPGWIDHVAGFSDSLDIIRRARESAEGNAKTAEDKGARLVQILLALLTVTLALGSYQLEYALSRSPAQLATLLPVGLALISLVLSAFGALQIDRVGKYSMPTGSELKSARPEDVPALLLMAELRGQMLADWSARHKHTDLMQARAWLTRGLAALLIAGLVAGVTRASSEAASARSHKKSAVEYATRTSANEI